jgi:hypothetical protein
MIFRAIEMALMIFQIPKVQIKKTVKETHATIQKCTFQLYDFKVP